jgi:hypothetical protein
MKLPMSSLSQLHVQYPELFLVLFYYIVIKTPL